MPPQIPLVNDSIRITIDDNKQISTHVSLCARGRAGVCVCVCVCVCVFVFAYVVCTCGKTTKQLSPALPKRRLVELGLSKPSPTLLFLGLDQLPGAEGWGSLGSHPGSAPAASKPAYHSQFLVVINMKEQEGLYNLFFHNCYNYKHTDDVAVSFTVSFSDAFPAILPIPKTTSISFRI